MRYVVGILAAVGCAAGLYTATIEAAVSCESLAALRLPNARVTAARVVAAGAFVAPAAGRGAGTSFADLPAFCRVEATLTPSADSDIKVEVWLPATNWNGKYQAVGNGGWAGSINYPALTDGLRRGYATSSTDTGHSGGDGTFALGHPEKLVDFAFRSVHEMAVQSKTVINSFYGAAPRLSYWTGCSAGGRQGFKEAQRFPDDFNGIVAGAPAIDWLGRAAQSLHASQAVHKSAESFLTEADQTLIHQAVVKACDAIDGTKDGILEDPRRCQFDLSSIQCRGEGQTGCLSAPKVEAARTIYTHNAVSGTGRPVASLFPGSELGWNIWAGAQPMRASVDHFRYVVFADAKWDPRSFVFDRDTARADQVDAGLVNALDPNLKPFFDRGGKIIHYHGWSDPQISPGNSVSYYESVAKQLGGAGNLSMAYRMFMVPGMAHCGGGDGPNEFDMLTPLEAWVEKGQAPDRIIASRKANGNVDRTRPLCPYPQVARYKGAGSIDTAENFVCAAP